jgi:hypothetical protein
MQTHERLVELYVNIHYFNTTLTPICQKKCSFFSYSSTKVNDSSILKNIYILSTSLKLQKML